MIFLKSKNFIILRYLQSINLLNYSFKHNNNTIIKQGNKNKNNEINHHHQNQQYQQQHLHPK